MQAIVTKYISPSNTRGTRIKATASAGSIIMGYDHALNVEENHAKAANMLANKYQWLETSECAVCGKLAPGHAAKGVNGMDHWWKMSAITLHGGQIPNGDYVWVMVTGQAK